MENEDKNEMDFFDILSVEIDDDKIFLYQEEIVPSSFIVKEAKVIHTENYIVVSGVRLYYEILVEEAIGSEVDKFDWEEITNQRIVRPGLKKLKVERNIVIKLASKGKNVIYLSK